MSISSGCVNAGAAASAIRGQGGRAVARAK
jgi:hypothetical protein